MSREHRQVITIDIVSNGYFIDIVEYLKDKGLKIDVIYSAGPKNNNIIELLDDVDQYDIKKFSKGKKDD